MEAFFMKKILSALVLVIFAGIFNFGSADLQDDYDRHPDYIFVTTGQMGVYYLYLPSVDVQEYNPPHYQISGHFIHYGGLDGKTLTNIYITLRYNWYTKETFQLKNGYWEKADVSGDYQPVRQNRQFADALFRAAYGMDFYGY